MRNQRCDAQYPWLYGNRESLCGSSFCILVPLPCMLRDWLHCVVQKCCILAILSLVAALWQTSFTSSQIYFSRGTVILVIGLLVYFFCTPFTLFLNTIIRIHNDPQQYEASVNPCKLQLLQHTYVLSDSESSNNSSMTSLLGQK